jgi:hypothetical protein
MLATSSITLLKVTEMTVINQQHWDTLYTKLYDAYEECSKNYDETYRQMIGEVLDHMINNKPYLNIK